MKVTVRSSRADRNGRHNDRNFNVDLATHIDKSKISDNIYYTYNGIDGVTFLDLERQYYEDHFKEAIEAQNRKNEAAGHKDRNRSIEDYHTATRTRPEDVILQIGDISEHASGEELWNCALEYKDKFDELFGEHCKILDMALHMDEETPHVHIRRVWQAVDEDGREIVSQERALREMDILRPDNTKADGKFNNAKMIFTQVDRELFTKICEDEGFMIERTPGRKRRHLEKDEYIDFKQGQIDSDALSKNAEEMFSLAMQDERLARIYAEKIKEIQDKSLAEKVRLSSEIMKDISGEITSVTGTIFDGRLSRIKSEEELSDEAKFIEERGLKSEFEKWKNDSKNEPEIDEKKEENSDSKSYDTEFNFF